MRTILKTNIFLIASIMLAAITIRAQNDTMYVYEGDKIIWQYAVEDIDSIIFYPIENEADTTPDNFLPKITAFENNTFVNEAGESFFPWGFNYTNPVIIGLIEDNWELEETWEALESDFWEMSDYGANVARIHLQYVKFMDGTTSPNMAAFEKLERLARIADKNNIYLIVTGLGSYRLSDTKEWYDDLDDVGRWETQKLFWETVAASLKDHSCVFAYDLMNEPVVANGCDPDSSACSWYPPGGQFGGYQFVQNISTEAGNPYWGTIAEWSDEMTASIREVDSVTMITLGLLPLGSIKTLAPHFDIISTHVYPKTGDIASSVNYVKNNQSDKPFVIEEIFNLSCTTDDLEIFLDEVDGYYHGFVGHYFGRTLEEHDPNILVDAIHKQFLVFFIENNPNNSN